MESVGQYKELRTLFERNPKGVVYSIGITEKESGKLTELVRGYETGCNLTEEKKEEILKNGVPVLYRDGKKEIFAEPFYPAERMLIFGGGHIAKCVADLAQMVGFYVAVCDDREEFANQERFPAADKVLCGSYEACVEALKPGRRDYCVIATRGHSEDITCLRKLFCYEEAAYVGLLGSRRRTAIVRENLQKEGLAEARLQRICTPIGMAIGARTIEEIGISIMAEVIKRRRLDRLEDSYIDRSDHDARLLAVFAELRPPCAIATIIKAEGSTPRAAGARMAIFSDGTLLGSIGGGCVENMVIHLGKNLIGTGAYRILKLDMEGKKLMKTGMVCGGWVQVLIEDFVL